MAKKEELTRDVGNSTVSNVILCKCKSCNFDTILNFCRGFRILPEEFLHSELFHFENLDIKRNTGSFGGAFWRMTVWNKVLRRAAEPRLEILRDCGLKLPDWKGGASMPAKPTRAFLLEKRETSPISAISCEPRTGPTPYKLMTVSYSGKEPAKNSISLCKEARVSLSVFSCKIAADTSAWAASESAKDGAQLQANA